MTMMVKLILDVPELLTTMAAIFVKRQPGRSINYDGASVKQFNTAMKVVNASTGRRTRHCIARKWQTSNVARTTTARHRSESACTGTRKHLLHVCVHSTLQNKNINYIRVDSSYMYMSHFIFYLYMYICTFFFYYSPHLDPSLEHKILTCVHDMYHNNMGNVLTSTEERETDHPRTNRCTSRIIEHFPPFFLYVFFFL